MAKRKHKGQSMSLYLHHAVVKGILIDAEQQEMTNSQVVNAILMNHYGIESRGGVFRATVAAPTQTLPTEEAQEIDRYTIEHKSFTNGEVKRYTLKDIGANVRKYKKKAAAREGKKGGELMKQRYDYWTDLQAKLEAKIAAYQAE